MASMTLAADDGSAMENENLRKKRAQEFDLDDVTDDSPLDQAEEEEADLELDDLEDHMGDDIDLQKDDFADEPFHKESLPDEP